MRFFYKANEAETAGKQIVFFFFRKRFALYTHFDFFGALPFFHFYLKYLWEYLETKDTNISIISKY